MPAILLCQIRVNMTRNALSVTFFECNRKVKDEINSRYPIATFRIWARTPKEFRKIYLNLNAILWQNYNPSGSSWFQGIEEGFIEAFQSFQQVSSVSRSRCELLGTNLLEDINSLDNNWEAMKTPQQPRKNLCSAYRKLQIQIKDVRSRGSYCYMTTVTPISM